MKITISGIRGVVGEDFTLKDVLFFCNNFSALVDSKKCVIARDTRPSGIMIHDIAMAALMQNGIDVYDLGMVPTPVVFRESRKIGAGLNVTSSHNPIHWNGLKFILKGRGINEEELKIVSSPQKITRERVGSESTIESTYVEDASKLIGETSMPLRVIVDVGGGAAIKVAPELLSKIGCKVNTINESITDSSRGPDPTSSNLADLAELSKKNDIGFAFDLDADRLVVVSNGKKQSPDLTLGLGIAKALELGYKKFVLSIDTSVAIEKIIKERHGTVRRSKVGEANVIELMLKTESQAGGEGSSAGFILPEFNYCRDGILTSGLIATMLNSSYFKEVVSIMQQFHQIRDKVNVDSKLHDKTMDLLMKRMSKKFSEVITLDGIKGIIDEDSWVLVRRSNTEDIIRVSVESDSLEKANSIKEEIKNMVTQCYDEIR